MKDRARSVFVTGTDTGCGKTLVTGLLARFLEVKGYKTITQKWVETGVMGSSPDITSHLKLMGKRKQELGDYLPEVSPCTFRFPASPHLASALEKTTINVDKIKKSFKLLQGVFDCVVVEGAGGVLVPLSKSRLVIDIVKELSLPALIVVGNKLGAINHTLLTIEALKRRRIKIIGIIFNNLSAKTSKVILEDNPKIIKAISRQNILGILPYLKDKDLLFKEFVPIGRKISAQISKIGR